MPATAWPSPMKTPWRFVPPQIPKFCCLTSHKEKIMKTNRNWQKISGWVLHGLVAGVMILAGSAKVLGFFPPEEVAKLGLPLPIQVIGMGELASAILLLVPRTSSL